MNILHLYAGRRRAVNPRGRQTTSKVTPIRIPHAVHARAPQRDAVTALRTPLRARWSRSVLTGAMECRWSVDAPAGRSRHRTTMSSHRFLRRGICASLRPPSR
jgi:hypothetical protein